MATNNKLLNCPHLRFPEFKDEWQQTTLGEVVDVLNSKRRPITSTERVKGNYPYYGASGVIDYVNDFIFEEQLLLVGEDGAKWGKYERTAFIVSGKFWVNNHAHVLRVKNVSVDKFVEACLVLRNIQTYVTGDAPPKLTLDNLKALPLSLPSLPEQKKIASFLSLLDERIEVQRQTIKERKNQKKALLSQIFSQALRFPSFSDEWQQTTLGEVAERVTRKNRDNITLRPLTISAQYGLIDQRDFFDKVVASSNLEGYYLLKKGEFAYNRSSSSSSPWGAIKRLVHYNEGALSTLYICFSLVSGDPIFFSYFFETTNWHDYIQSVSAEGARNHGLLNIAVSDFFDMPISLPSLAEQKKIAELFTIFDERIEVEEALLACYERQKRYLLRQMFV